MAGPAREFMPYSLMLTRSLAGFMLVLVAFLSCTAAVVNAASLALIVWQLIGSQRYGRRPSRFPAHSVQRR